MTKTKAVQKHRRRKKSLPIPIETVATPVETVATVEKSKQQSLSEILASLPPEKKELIKRTVAKDATDDELELFFHVCARNNTHPLDRLIIFTKFNDGETGEKQVVLISTIDFFRARSFEYGNLAGIDPPVFQGEIKETNGQVVPAYCRVTGYKLLPDGTRAAYHGEARWSEFCPASPKRKARWLRMPYNMLAKCAEAQMHRKIAPTRLHNIYLSEEMERALEKHTPAEVHPQHGQEMIKQLLERNATGKPSQTAPQNVTELPQAIATKEIPITQPKASPTFDNILAKLKIAKTEKQILEVKRRFYPLLTQQEQLAFDRKVTERLGEIAKLREPKPKDDIAEQYRMNLALDMLNVIRRRYPDYRVKGKTLPLEQQAAIEQAIVEAFGVTEKQLATLTTEAIESGLEKLQTIMEGTVK